MFRSAKKLSPIAIDLGSSAIKMLQLEQAGDQWRVLAAAKFEYPPMTRRTEERAPLTLSALQTMLKRYGFRGRQAVTLVPNQYIQYKSFRLPVMPDDELEQVIRFEAEERFAYQNGEGEFQYLRAGEVRQGQDVRQEIIVMGCPQEVLRQQMELLEQLRLVCMGIDVSPCALARCFSYSPDGVEHDNAQVIADLGQHCSTITMVRDGQVIFAKTIAIGGNTLDEYTAKHLNLSLSEAAQVRRQILQTHAHPQQSARSLDSEVLDAASEATKPALEQLAKEIGLCLRYYAVTFRGVRPEMIICCGGESYSPTVLETITEITGVATQAGRPLELVSTQSIFSESERRGGLLEWSTAMGLAWREVLQPREEQVAC
ncbi:MAG: hypothetical protein HJJLKODD_01754 [Phycisphaerae bacterium]|nr:hypothetical protein [Phycisphaerae bacterium]